MKRKIISVLLVTTLIIGCFTIATLGASGSKKMTTYNVIKKGNIVYCAARRGVFKVNLISGKVSKLANKDKSGAYYNGGVYALKLYKNYIYFLDCGPMLDSLKRVKTGGGKVKELSSLVAMEYAISKNKIYFRKYVEDYDTGSGEVRNKVMSLSGKNKKGSSYKAKMTTKKTNKKGYYIKSVYKGTTNDKEFGEVSKYTDYLVRPSGKKIKLCTYIG